MCTCCIMLPGLSSTSHTEHAASGMQDMPSSWKQNCTAAASYQRHPPYWNWLTLPEKGPHDSVIFDFFRRNIKIVSRLFGTERGSLLMVMVYVAQVLPSSGHLGLRHSADGVGNRACALCKLQLDQHHHHDHAQPCAAAGAQLFRRNSAPGMS